MFERFTEKAIKVIMLAQEEARRLGWNHVGTEMILLGIIGEGVSPAAKAMKANALNLKDLRIAVENVIGRGHGFCAVEIPFTPKAKVLLETSWEIAREENGNSIGPEHLFYALLKTDGNGMRVVNSVAAPETLRMVTRDFANRLAATPVALNVYGRALEMAVGCLQQTLSPGAAGSKIEYWIAKAQEEISRKG